MKLGKRILTVLLAALLTASMAACGGNGNTSQSSTTESSGTSSSTETSSDTETSETSGNDGEVVKLVVWGQGTANTEDVNEVAAAISDITRDSIGVEIEFVRGQDGEQVNLALTSGEQIDLLNYNPVSGGLTSLVRNNYATPLDDLVEEYGQGALELIDPVDLESCRIGGVLYSLPNMRDTTWSVGFGYRQDILDELGIEVGETTSFDEFHDILVQVKEAYPDMYPVVPSWSGGGMQIPMGLRSPGRHFGCIGECI